MDGVIDRGGFFVKFETVRSCVEWVIFLLLISYTWFTVNFFVACFVSLVTALPYCIVAPAKMKGVLPDVKELIRRVCFYVAVFLLECLVNFISLLILGVSDSTDKESENRNNACSLIEEEKAACSERHGVVEDYLDRVYESIAGFNAPFGLDLSALQYALIVAILSNAIAFVLLLLVQCLPLKGKSADC